MTDDWIIINTDVVSYLMRGGKLAEIYARHIQGKKRAISFITVGELYFGAEKANWGIQKRIQLENALKNFVVIPFDIEIARIFGFIVAERDRKGKPISFHDAWIAACAIRHKVGLVTHNAKDFDHISSLDVITERDS